MKENNEQKAALQALQGSLAGVPFVRAGKITALGDSADFQVELLTYLWPRNKGLAKNVYLDLDIHIFYNYYNIFINNRSCFFIINH